MKNKSFKNYLRLSFIKSAIIIIFLAYMLFVVFLALNIRSSTIQLNKKDNQNLLQNLNEWQNKVINTLNKLILEKEIAEALKNPKRQNYNINSMLYSNINALPLKCLFVLSDKYDNIVVTNLNKDNKILFINSPRIKSIKDSLSFNYSKNYSGYSRIPYLYNQNSAWIFAKNIIANKEFLGILYLDLMNDSIREALSHSKSDSIVIVDQFDNVVYTDNIKAIGPLGKLSLKIEEDGFYSLDEKSYYVSRGNFSNNELGLLTFSSTVLHEQIKKYGFILISVAAVMLVIASSLISDIVSAKNLKPINTIVKTIQNHDLSKRIDKKTYVEFQPLYTEFNSLMDRIETLIKHNEALSEHKRIIEVKHLKEQFNPHFVFNVMENIRFVMLQNPQKASEMLVAFANLLRYEIDETMKKVELELDLEYVNDYLLLQKMRYGEGLNYSFDIPESLLDCKIPKLLIQPIVENSLKHGFGNRGSLSLNISARAENDILIICIKDNGIGIEQSALDQLIISLENENGNTKHIGLYNTHRVLRLMYGDLCGLSIFSDNTGTRVEIRIPEEA